VRLSPRRRFSRRGEVAVFDIVLFIPLLIIALLLLDTVVTTPVTNVAENVNSSRYAAEGLATTLGATVRTTNIWAWFPPAPPQWSPCPNPWQGCWYPFYGAQDYSVAELVELDAYLVSCHANTVFGTVVTQAQLDTPGWMGWSIGIEAQSVAEGIVAGSAGQPTTYNSYFFDFNGTSYSYAGSGCVGPVTPMRTHFPVGSGYPAYPTGQVYTWSVALTPDFPGEASVLVEMAFWGP
jgi:hypothetical protein